MIGQFELIQNGLSRDFAVDEIRFNVFKFQEAASVGLPVKAKRQEINMPEQHIASQNIVSRRSFLKQAITLPGALFIVACAGSGSNTGSTVNTISSPQAAKTFTTACSG